MIVYVRTPAGHQDAQISADMVTADETRAGGLTVSKYHVNPDGDLIPLGTRGFAPGSWEEYQETEMPSEDVKARILGAETREAEAEDAKAMRLGGKF